MRRFCLSLVIFAITALVVSPSTFAEGVPDSRFEKLTRGFNVDRLRQVPPEPLRMERLEAMRRAGMQHVRLAVNIANMTNPERPGGIIHDRFQAVEEALETLLGMGFAVIVETHDVPSDLWGPDDEYAKDFAVFLRHLARRIDAKSSPEEVFIEVVNEPSARTAERWNEIQPLLIQAMRQGAPHHTLIANANQRASENDWDQVAALERLETVDDPNVIYNFHFYAPTVFTHQTAEWGWEMWRHFRAVPYPGTPERIEAMLDQIEHEGARQHLRRYAEESWNAEKIDGLMARAAAWAEERGVRLTCNEFGVYRRTAPDEDRRAYLRDLREALERHGIGWAIWFGYGFTGEGDEMRLDPDDADALGLWGE